jgi:hypothetical protein
MRHGHPAIPLLPMDPSKLTSEVFSMANPSTYSSAAALGRVWTGTYFTRFFDQYGNAKMKSNASYCSISLIYWPSRLVDRLILNSGHDGKASLYMLQGARAD